MELSEWMSRLQIGSIVGVTLSSTRGDRIYTGRVKRLTKTQFIVHQIHPEDPEIEYRFRRSDGREPGDTWHRNRIQEYDEQFQKRIRLKRLRIRAAHAIRGLKIPKTEKGLMRFIKSLEQVKGD